MLLGGLREDGGINALVCLEFDTVHIVGICYNYYTDWLHLPYMYCIINRHDHDYLIYLSVLSLTGLCGGRSWWPM